MTAEVQKVVCYVTHDHHLLVFTHDTVPIEVAGVQVPAGTIAANESPEHAAVRELYEETGRRGRIVRKLGVARYDLRPARDEIAVRHFFHVTLPSGDPRERWKAGEPDVPAGHEPISWTCWWLPITDAHVLAAGFGALIGQLSAGLGDG